MPLINLSKQAIQYRRDLSLSSGGLSMHSDIIDLQEEPKKFPLPEDEAKVNGRNRAIGMQNETVLPIEERLTGIRSGTKRTRAPEANDLQA